MRCCVRNRLMPGRRQLSFMDITERLDRIQEDSAMWKSDYDNGIRIMENLASTVSNVQAMLERLAARIDRLDGGEATSPRNPSSRPGTATMSSSGRREKSPSTRAHQPSIPYNHSTSAHKLVLYWKSIKPFYRTVGDIDYVTNGEHARPTLVQIARKQRARARPHGVMDGLPTLGSHPAAVSMIDSDCQSTGSSILAADSFTSYSSMTSPACRGHEFHQNKEAFVMPTNLKLSAEEARSVFEGYLHHIHILHPIIDAPKTENIINSFVAERPHDSPMQRQFSNNSAKSLSARRNLKRKLSPTHDDFSPLPHQHAAYCTNGGAADTAVALLVIALGKICANHANPVAVPTSQSMAANSQASFYSPYYTADSFAQSWSSHSSTSRSFGNFESKDGIEMPSFTVGPAGDHLPEEAEPELPGLAFYLHATQILGDLFGENDLAYVHGLLLAGLYCAFLVRPVESSRWINAAATAMQIILKA